MKRFLDWLLVRRPAPPPWTPLSPMPAVLDIRGGPVIWALPKPEPLKFPEIDESLLPTKETT
jgi:hypothetical protein